MRARSLGAERPSQRRPAVATTDGLGLRDSGGAFPNRLDIGTAIVWDNRDRTVVGFAPMGKRQKAWARVARARLMETLGNRCVECGSLAPLVFDCIDPTGDAHHRMDTSARMSFYFRQHQAGNLQILCDACNTRKSASDYLTHQQKSATTRVPRPPQGHHEYADTEQPF